MMGKNKKSRNKRQRRRGRKSMRRTFNGGLTRGSIQPRTVSVTPWCSVSLTSYMSPVKAKDALYCVNLSAVRKQLLLELGLQVTQEAKVIPLPVDIRVFHVDIWTSPARANTDDNFIVMSPSEYTSASCDARRQLGWYENWGTAVRPAHIHYSWPRYLTTHVFGPDDDAELVAMDLKTAASMYIMRFRLQWRASSPDPRPTVSCDLTSFRGCSDHEEWLLCETMQTMDSSIH